ncbi:hypothetical protein CTAYLR_004921 [Chrysophaeum taylorii]|uniref:Major facilitator superfamily (MFS) profile domain-containing protein n=1 Tax=Chrysophaeum taylorii TaxID=2483200 RepID=A0AAD7XQG9_9STRA|nr:hypothetical protein CTAYLR_004921 [Chrysophaeum taylorii]
MESASSSASSSSSRNNRSAMRRKLTLGILTLANCSNFWQRNLIYFLCSASPHECLGACEGAVFVPLCEKCDDSHKCDECQHCRRTHDADFYSLRDAACMSDAQYGFLASVSFTVMFAASGILAGSIADRVTDTRCLHASAILAWSLASFAKVISPTFPVLVVARFVLGVAQGFNAPCAYPMILAHFAPPERATANGLYSSGTYLGAALSSLSLVAAMLLGWRAVAIAAVFVGLFAAALVYLVIQRPHDPEDDDDAIILCGGGGGGGNGSPRRGRRFVVRTATTTTASVKRNDASAFSLAAAWTRIITNGRLALLYAATSLRMTTTVSLWTYLPTFYARTFPKQVVAFSVAYALGTLVCGAASSALGGAIADALVRRGKTGARGHVPALGTLASVLPISAALFATSFSWSATLLLLNILLAECWLGPCMALLARDVPTHAMGTHVALLIVCNQLLAGLGPWAISVVDDGTTRRLRTNVLVIVTFFSLLASAAFSLLGTLHAATDDDPERRRHHRAESLSRGDPSPEEARALLATTPADISPPALEPAFTHHQYPSRLYD